MTDTACPVGLTPTALRRSAGRRIREKGSVNRGRRVKVPESLAETAVTQLLRNQPARALLFFDFARLSEMILVDCTTDWFK